MGKERDALSRRYGGVTVAEQRLSDTELMRRYVESNADEGRLPAEIEAIRRKNGLSGRHQNPGFHCRSPR